MNEQKAWFEMSDDISVALIIIETRLKLML